MHPAPSASDAAPLLLRPHERVPRPLAASSHGLVQLSAGPPHHTAAVQQLSCWKPQAGVIARRRPRPPPGPSAVRARRDIRLGHPCVLTRLPWPLLAPPKRADSIHSQRIAGFASLAPPKVRSPTVRSSCRLSPARLGSPALPVCDLRATPAARAWRLYSTSAIAMGFMSRALRSAPSNHSRT